MRPERVFIGESVEASTRNGDRAEVLVPKTAGFDTDF